MPTSYVSIFLSNATPPTEIYTLSLHDALPIFAIGVLPLDKDLNTWLVGQWRYPLNEYSWEIPEGGGPQDRKSTRLNSSHSQISYAVFCLKKKKKKNKKQNIYRKYMI